MPHTYPATNCAIAVPTSAVPACRPCHASAARSRAAPSRSHRRSRRPAAASPRCSSIIAPDQIWPIGLAMRLPAMSGAEPCTGSNIDGKLALRIEVGRRRDADRAGHGRPQIGQDVAEQVGADDDIEPVRVLHEVRASGCRCGTGRCGSSGYVRRHRRERARPSTAS